MHRPLRCCHLWMKVKVRLISLDHKRCTSMTQIVSLLLRSRGYDTSFLSSLHCGKIVLDGLSNLKTTGYTSPSRITPSFNPRDLIASPRGIKKLSMRSSIAQGKMVNYQYLMAPILSDGLYSLFGIKDVGDPLLIYEGCIQRPLETRCHCPSRTGNLECRPYGILQQSRPYATVHGQDS